jgi:uncharacterized membrane protein YagU involved in acid resistance
VKDFWSVAGRGAIAGAAGGSVSGLAMAELGTMSTVAALVRVESPWAGFAVHLVISVLIGGLFAVLVRHQSAGEGETVFWGLAYGMFWWYFGALTLSPLLLGEEPAWTVAGARAAFPSLIGHLLYGATTGLVLAFLRSGGPAARYPSIGVVLRGAASGAVAAVLLTMAVGDRFGPVAVSPSMMEQPWSMVATAVLGLGVMAGVGFAVLYPRAPDASGPSLIRGAGYGFLLWVAFGLTIVPLVEQGELAWSADAVRRVFPTLPAYLLLGVAVALAYNWADRSWRLLFTAPVERAATDEGVGARTLRAVGRGAVAGGVGGLLFTVVMAQIGFFPTVARLAGAGSATAGLVVHLAISLIIGAAYGVLFRRQTHDAASALGWGTAYGFLWWVLGMLTLLPIFLGSDPTWTADQVARTFPSLVGHLAYGTGLGVTFYVLEARYDPWWLPRGMAQTARVAARRAALESSAPAVWTLVVLMAFTVTVVV